MRKWVFGSNHDYDKEFSTNANANKPAIAAAVRFMRSKCIHESALARYDGDIVCYTIAISINNDGIIHTVDTMAYRNVYFPIVGGNQYASEFLAKTRDKIRKEEALRWKLTDKDENNPYVKEYNRLIELYTWRDVETKGNYFLHHVYELLKPQKECYRCGDGYNTYLVLVDAAEHFNLHKLILLANQREENELSWGGYLKTLKTARSQGYIVDELPAREVAKLPEIPRWMDRIKDN